MIDPGFVMPEEAVDALALELGATESNGWIAFETLEDAVAFGELLDEERIVVDLLEPADGDDVLGSEYVGNAVGFKRRV